MTIDVFSKETNICMYVYIREINVRVHVCIFKDPDYFLISSRFHEPR